MKGRAGRTVWRLIGPALLFSGAAIGTSHLVQSTRAGAMYGLGLVGVILLANVLKYPAYRFGVDYGHARHRSIMAGYRELGLWAPLLFAAVAIAIVPIVHAALAAATAGIAIAVTGASLPVPVVGSALLAIVAAILLVGGYDWLDRINRVLLAFLVLSTLATTAMVLPRVDWATLTDLSWTGDPKAILFVIALAGFMPNPLDVSVGQSMWTAEAEKRLPPGERSDLRDARDAFLVGYMMTAVLAVCFCIMGAGVMHTAGVDPETSAPGFAAQVIGLYSAALGEGAAALAAVAALSVMLTTLLAAIDLGARYVATFWEEGLMHRGDRAFTRVYRGAVPLLGLAASAVLFLFTASFTAMLDLATSAAFVGAPVIAAVNHLVVTRASLPEDARPGPAIRALNLAGITIMAALAVAYFLL
ncbi:hypothetical protein N0B51_08245 [Tsuneonella sp. YG55]|uniref:Natural resistance-associated macrophage protein n=1 Tax=Tsuneonella litorea TaxID=2976475 RepID=A0A9X2W143_9SPHN|nr:hypothetical protein [Tsuneonella litorea]MCT2558968.1 hypothetical protein [Tsuneonella litorea]